jgi:hypothetical protein
MTVSPIICSKRTTTRQLILTATMIMVQLITREQRRN